MSLFSAALYAQEAQTPLEEQVPINEHPISEEKTEEEKNQETRRADSPETRRIEMELKTSTLSELAAWCRTLKLSEGGTKEEIIKRLREYFNLAEPKPQENEKTKTITIESAQSTEYFTVDVTDEDYARLKGGVKLRLKDGDKVHNISADEILFNRTRNIITASGNVKYERVESDKTETFRGNSITVNIDNWSSVFIDGKSTMEDGGSSYLFSGSVIYRSDQDVTILRKATISSGLDDNAYWSISSSRLWLLPGSDFAIFNAVLKVGEIPVLYIPFFYFPGDDMVFHPVIGYRSREGGFIQTTTYIIGQPKASSSESSLTKIIGNSNNNEKELQGLFLRNTSRPVKDANSISLKALFDYYVNLGAFAGLELTTPKTGILNQLDFNFGLGFTRTVYNTSFGFSPYAPNYDGTFDINKSNFLSMNVPFRYRMKFSSGITMKYGGLSWDIPYYSDPYVDSDFNKRAESMDWMNMIQQGAAFDATSTENEQSPYTWQLSGNFSPSLPILSPFISTISISSISTSLKFMTLIDNVQTNNYSPSRKFFAPDKYIIYSVSGSVSGSPVKFGETQSNKNKTTENKTQDETEDDPFNGIGVPISPWSKDGANVDKSTSSEILVPPALSQSFTLPSDGRTKIVLDYSISPAASSELQFMYKDFNDKNLLWNTYEDVDWSKSESILTNITGRTDLNFRIDHSSGLYSNVFNLAGSGSWREFSYINKEKFTDPATGIVDEDAMGKKFKEQYSQTNYTSSLTYTGSVKPFLSNSIFSQTNFQYIVKGTVVKSKRFSGGDKAELSPQWFSWVKENLNEDSPGLTVQRLTANLIANIFDKDQTISASAELPPLDGLVTANATFKVWITETFFGYRMERPETEEEWKIKPFEIRETLRFGNAGSFINYLTFTPEEDNKLTYLSSSLTLWNFKANYIMTWIQKSVFKPDNEASPHEGGKWETEGDKSLLPKDLSFSYNRVSTVKKYFNNRLDISYSIDTKLKFDLQEHTNSSFDLTLTFNTLITNFLKLSISATSQNAVIFRYFKGVPGMEEYTKMYPEGEQNNFFIDLFDSFNFFDEAKRRRSGFKMQKFDLKLEHYLGDWTAKFEINMYPFQKTTSGAVTEIKIVSDISFFLQWTPIMEIKSDISYNGREDRWIKK